MTPLLAHTLQFFNLCPLPINHTPFWYSERKKMIFLWTQYALFYCIVATHFLIISCRYVQTIQTCLSSFSSYYSVHLNHHNNPFLIAPFLKELLQDMHIIIINVCEDIEQLQLISPALWQLMWQQLCDRREVSLPGLHKTGIQTNSWW